MKLRMGWVLGLLIGGALAVGTSCGGRAKVDGTDSHTHWLKECESDGQCGNLSCICGVCSSACDEANECRGFGVAATCEVPLGCDARGPTACVLPSSTGVGGSVNTGGGTSGGTSSGGGAAPLACAAMDARSNGDDCASTIGYTWTGTRCQAVNCGCAGDDCEAIFARADDCDHAFRQCYESRKVSRSCTTHGDCVLQPRTCCPSCGARGNSGAGDVLIATSSAAPSLRDAGICIGDPQAACEEDCAPSPLAAVYPACIEGECRLLDVEANAGCDAVEDCRLSTKDCCDCGGDFSDAGLIAISSFAPHPYCAPDMGCPECQGGTPSDRARATCDVEQGLCRVGFIPK